MRNIELQFNFTSLNPELVNQIQAAISNNEPFGLTNGRVINVFDVKSMQSGFCGSNGRYWATQQFSNLQRFTEGISLALLACKEFVPVNRLLPLFEQKNLSYPFSIE